MSGRSADGGEPLTDPDSTPPAASKTRRGQREPSELPVRYFLDSRLFRRLCAPEASAALDGFRASLERHGIAPEGGLPDLEMTPFAFLDAIGVAAPPYDTFFLPQNVIKSGESFLITGFVSRMAKDFYEKAPALQVENLRKRVEELREKTNPAAHELFDLCLTRFVSREGFEGDILGHLAFDFLFRYPFPEAVREMVFHFLAASPFAIGESVAGLSKVRIIKTTWDRSYERLLKKQPDAREEIQALDREMRLRTSKDYLEWEVVHHSILGYAAGEQYHPVTAFTTDSEETVKLRCSAYKTALRAFLDQINREELATTLRPRIHAWRPGWLVPCHEDGTFGAVISTGELAVF
jgi:hypothetical protein